jgi:hypothetical protein
VRLCQSRMLSGFTERSGGDASDTDGQPARASKRERTSQTPYNTTIEFLLESVIACANALRCHETRRRLHHV